MSTVNLFLWCTSISILSVISFDNVDSCRAEEVRNCPQSSQQHLSGVSWVVKVEQVFERKIHTCLTESTFLLLGMFPAIGVYVALVHLLS